jgi:hypothetical protein
MTLTFFRDPVKSTYIHEESGLRSKDIRRRTLGANNIND